MLQIDKVKLLEKMSLFVSTPKTVIEELASALKEIRLEANQEFIHKGEAPDCLYLVYKGKVGVYDGNYLITEIHQNHSVGEYALLTSQPRIASVKTLEKSVLFRLEQEDFYEILGSRLEVLQAIIHQLADRLQTQNQERITILEEYQQDLQKLVEQRTQEIRQKNDALEKRSTELSNAYHLIQESLYSAKQIQYAIFKKTEDIVVNFTDAFVLFKPKDIVSGDFYWYDEIDKKVLVDNIKTEQKFSFSQMTFKHLKILIAADCTGHGARGAFITVMGNNFLNEIIKVNGIHRPKEILFELDRRFLEVFKNKVEEMTVHDGMDLGILVIDEEAKTLTFGGAKNPLIYIHQNKMQVIKATPFPIGSKFITEAKIFEEHTFHYEKGDKFYMFSDGFQDQFGGKNYRKFMRRRFYNLLESIQQLPMQKQYETLDKTFEEWKGSSIQTDDVLVIGIKM